MKLFVVLASCLVAVSAQSCSEDGLFPDARQCDRYISCKDGESQEHLCPDGLVFGENYTNVNYPCAYMIDVDCEDRTELQPAQPTALCPRQWGYYGTGNSAECGHFYNCVNGFGHKITCPEGLAFSSLTYTCVFADQSPDCDTQAYLGFTCPAVRDGAAVHLFGTARYASPRDCRTYFLCFGTSPRLQKCDLGHVYNPAAHNCDEPENVPECSDYYPADTLAEIRRQREERRIAQEERQERLRAIYAERRLQRSQASN